MILCQGKNGVFREVRAHVLRQTNKKTNKAEFRKGVILTHYE
jgi:hypothetical protein